MDILTSASCQREQAGRPRFPLAVVPVSAKKKTLLESALKLYQQLREPTRQVKSAQSPRFSRLHSRFPLPPPLALAALEEELLLLELEELDDELLLDLDPDLDRDRAGIFASVSALPVRKEQTRVRSSGRPTKRRWCAATPA